MITAPSVQTIAAGVHVTADHIRDLYRAAERLCGPGVDLLLVAWPEGDVEPVTSGFFSDMAEVLGLRRLLNASSLHDRLGGAELTHQAARQLAEEINEWSTVERIEVTR